MRKALVRVQGKDAAVLEERAEGYTLTYRGNYEDGPVSLSMPVRAEPYHFDHFPSFFDGLLPEGWQLDAFLRAAKLDRTDYMGQLLRVGADTVGDVTVEVMP
ncbi:HipA N-terminal domain-containing protein [Rhodothermus sp. AH-315-K08]|nr:HipA N-terminal domain-containing protein [Rhodothermus sp. AH-315-K08]